MHIRNLFILLLPLTGVAQIKDYPIQPVSFTQVKVTDHFWQPKMNVNATVTIPYILEMCKKHGRIDNFLAAAVNARIRFALNILSTIPMCTNG